MILADINVLIYAFDETAAKHTTYRNWLIETLSGSDPFALVDTVLAGFARIVTHPKIYDEPAGIESALEFVEFLIDADNAQWLHPGRAAWNALSDFSEVDSGVRGVRVPDAYLAAVAKSNGARLATADRGFARYPGLQWFDPAFP